MRGRSCPRTDAKTAKQGIQVKTTEHPSNLDDPKWEDEVSIEWEVDKNRDPYRWWLRFNALRTGQSARMHFATIYNPVPDMVVWLEHLSKGHPTGSFCVDEEGWCLRFLARPLNNLSDDDLFELRIDNVAWMWPDEDENDREVNATLLLVKTRRQPFVAALKRILLDVVKYKRAAIKASPTGDIDADWGYNLHGKRWKDIIARLDEIETAEMETELNS